MQFFLLVLALPAVEPLSPRLPNKIVRPTRLPVWPAWQGLPLGILSQGPGPCRSWADRLEAAFGGRVAPMQFDAREADPFILLVHHRHAFRPFDFLRPLFSAVIMPEGFPAHPHRGFETVTYVLPGRAGLTHRDSEGTKMRYGDGAVQWMTAGRGMLHEEMWDVDAGSDAELYQLWVNLPPTAKVQEEENRAAARSRLSSHSDQATPRILTKRPSLAPRLHQFAAPRVQLLEPRKAASTAAEVTREGSTAVRRAPIAEESLQGGRVMVRYLAGGGADGSSTGAETYTPMTIAHVELNGEAASHTLPLPEGWTFLVYVRKGAVGFGGGAVADREGSLPGVAEMHEMAYLPRAGGECIELTNAASNGRVTDVLVLAGQPIGAPVITSGTMVMNSDLQVPTMVHFRLPLRLPPHLPSHPLGNRLNLSCMLRPCRCSRRWPTTSAANLAYLGSTQSTMLSGRHSATSDSPREQRAGAATNDRMTWQRMTAG